MWLELSLAVLACITAGLAFFINDLLGKRRQLAGLPQPPMQNLLMGHLYIADECMRIFPKRIHSHIWADYIREKWKLPETFYVDWRPFGPLWLFTADPEVSAEYFLVKQNLPKSPREKHYLDKFLGYNNMVTLEGTRHKNLRTIFNPGFSVANLMSYTDAIVDATMRFLEVMKEKAKNQELFELEEYATRLTIDIIGVAVFDKELNAQFKTHPIVQHFRTRVLMMPPADAIFPWQGVDLLRPVKLWLNGRHLDRAINVELDNKLARRAKDLESEEAGDPPTRKKKSIIDLALNAYEKEMAMGNNIVAGDKVKRIVDSKAMPTQLRQDLIASIKTFFFAGHDTTSSTLAWCYYMLHRNPEAQARLTAELDEVFPPGSSAAEKIKQDPYIINKLEYTNAVVKETLRIFPPASTLRMTDAKYPAPAMSFTDRRTGANFFLDDVDIWPIPHLIHRNRRLFPEPTKFIPERFIPSKTPFPEAELFEPAGKHAFHPFAIGPRNCIGQELAMIEARIVLALTVRELDFVVEYPGEAPDPQPPIPNSTAEELDEKTPYGQAIRKGMKHTHIEGHRVWPTLKGTAKPVQGCPGRMKIRERH